MSVLLFNSEVYKLRCLIDDLDDGAAEFHDVRSTINHRRIIVDVGAHKHGLFELVLIERNGGTADEPKNLPNAVSNWRG